MKFDSEIPLSPIGSSAWQALLAKAPRQSKAQFKAWLNRLIAQLDALLSEQLSEVIQHPQFQQLEASWTGVESLTEVQVSQRRVKIKLLDASWQVVASDLN
ncbi:type VI secretion system contractile sheath large subunit, partial [Vibrio lentus]|uniref:type VI secretion system contractile sheath domain-containing protein n=2 Tax=Vibrionaceae TaxID=641 RepID=UPI001E5B2B6B